MAQINYVNLIRTLAMIGDDVKADYKDQLTKSKKVVTGKLYNSVEYKVKVDGDTVTLYFLAEKYYLVIENGRKVGAKMPPLMEIQKWMIKRKLPDLTMEHAWKIARKISSKGLKAFHLLSKVTKKLTNSYKTELEDAIREDVGEYMKFEVEQIGKRIKRKLKS